MGSGDSSNINPLEAFLTLLLSKQLDGPENSRSDLGSELEAFKKELLGIKEYNK